MRTVALFILAGLALTACGAAPGPEVRTAYRQGDYVIYQYRGSFTPAPVKLTQQVIERVGDRLTIEVRAVRGDERRTWRQIVIDRPEARATDQVEALLEWRDGRFEQVPNSDLFRLLAWTLPEGGGRIELGPTRQRTLELGGVPHACTVQTGQQLIGDLLTDIELTTCPDFVWGQGPAIARVPGGEVVWQVKVLDAGGH